MIDILLIVVYVVNSEKFVESFDDPSALLSKLNDPNSIQSDSFQLFSEIMRIGYLSLQNSVVPNKHKNEKSVMGLKCERIHHFYLKSLDPELYNLLETHKIPVENHLK